MNSVKWIKLSTRIFDDEKIKIIEGMPEGDAILVVWIKLLVLAANSNGDGTIRLNEQIPYTDELLATVFRRSVMTVRLALETFANFGMIAIHEDQTIEIARWGAYQEVASLEKIRQQTRARVSKHRQNKALPSPKEEEEDIEEEEEGNVTCNVTKKGYTPEFELWYEGYPRKVSKRKAQSAWNARIKEGVSVDELTRARNTYRNKVRGKDSEYTMHPSTFLGKDRRWEDYLEKDPHYYRPMFNETCPKCGAAIMKGGCHECGWVAEDYDA